MEPKDAILGVKKQMSKDDHLSNELGRLVELKRKSDLTATHRRFEERLDGLVAAEADAFVAAHRDAGDPLGILRALRERTKLEIPLSLSERIQRGDWRL